MKRYELEIIDTGIGTFPEYIEEEDGFWVKYEDAKKLFEALKTYGQHRNDSAMLCERLKHSDYPCTCGLEDIIRKFHTG